MTHTFEEFLVEKAWRMNGVHLSRTQALESMRNIPPAFMKELHEEYMESEQPDYRALENHNA